MARSTASEAAIPDRNAKKPPLITMTGWLEPSRHRATILRGFIICGRGSWDAGQKLRGQTPLRSKSALTQHGPDRKEPQPGDTHQENPLGLRVWAAETARQHGQRCDNGGHGLSSNAASQTEDHPRETPPGRAECCRDRTSRKAYRGEPRSQMQVWPSGCEPQHPVCAADGHPHQERPALTPWHHRSRRPRIVGFDRHPAAHDLSLSSSVPRGPAWNPFHSGAGRHRGQPTGQEPALGSITRSAEVPD